MSSVVIAGNTSGSITISAPDVSGSNTLTLPVATDTLVGKATTDTLTNKTLVNPTITDLQTLNTPNTFGFKNRIINGGMVIDQRNAGASVTPTTTATGYAVDRFGGDCSVNSKYTVQQSTTTPTGFNYSLKATSSSAYSVSAGDYFYLSQAIEGYNVADLGFGTANAKTFTLSFWVQSSLTGTFGGSFRNGAGNRSYPFTYTISSANTWEQKSITVAGDTSGTWLTTNGAGLRVEFGLGVGSTYSGTAGAWSGTTYLSATGAVSVVGTSGATFYITGVQLEKGSTDTSFDFRDYGRELAMCQRYFALVTNTSSTGEHGFSNGFQSSTTGAVFVAPTPVSMRTEPTITISNLGVSDQVATTNAATISGISSTSNGSLMTVTYSAFGAQYRPCVLVSRSTFIGRLTFSSEL